MLYAWPGNVRELRNVVTAAAARVEARQSLRIDAEDVLIGSRGGPSAESPGSEESPTARRFDSARRQRHPRRQRPRHAPGHRLRVLQALRDRPCDVSALNAAATRKPRSSTCCCRRSPGSCSKARSRCRSSSPWTTGTRSSHSRTSGSSRTSCCTGRSGSSSYRRPHTGRCTPRHWSDTMRHIDRRRSWRSHRGPPCTPCRRLRSCRQSSEGRRSGRRIW